MRIKDKKTGKIVEIPQHLEGEVEKAIAAGVDPIAILGADLKKAQNGTRLGAYPVPLSPIHRDHKGFAKYGHYPIKEDSDSTPLPPERVIDLGNTTPKYYDFGDKPYEPYDPYNFFEDPHKEKNVNKYNNNNNTESDGPFNFQPRDEGAELNQTQFPQEYNQQQQQNFPLRPQEPTYQMDKLPIKPLTENSYKTPTVPTPTVPTPNPPQTDTRPSWQSYIPGMNPIGGNTYLAKGVAQLGSGLTNIGKGTAEYIGNNRLKNRETARNAMQYPQTAFSDAMDRGNKPQDYIPNRNGFRAYGGKVYSDGGMSIREIGGQGEDNVEVEGNEHILLPNGLSEEVKGASHEQGGIPLNLPEGSMIFSEKLKDPTTGKSYSKMAKPFETKKDAKLLNTKYADEVQKQTADKNIKFKEAQLKSLFDLQEKNKLEGSHGTKIQLEALQELQGQQPIAQNGKLMRYDVSGATAEQMAKANNAFWTNALGSGVPPNKSENWNRVFYDNLNKYARKKKVTIESLINNPHEYYQEIVSGGKQDLLPIPEDLIPDLIRNKKMGLTAKHRELLKDAGISGAKDIVDFSKLSSADLAKLKNKSGNANFDLDRDFLSKGYNDNLKGHRGVTFKGENITPEEAVKKYGKSPFFYNTSPDNLLFNYEQGANGEHIIHYPNPRADVSKKVEGDVSAPFKPNITETRGNNNFNMPNFNMGIPLPYNETTQPLNYYKLQPEYVDPRYLNNQQQLNSITRGDREFQNNLGDRSTSSLGMSLQSQLNARNQEEQAFANKYNYDKQQDSFAQQTNAQNIMQTGQYNQQSWYNQLEDPIRARGSAKNKQRKENQQRGLENWQQAEAFNNNANYINNTFYPNQGVGSDYIDFGTQALKDPSAYAKGLSLKAKQAVDYERAKKKYEEENPVVRNGGKVKIRPKIKSKK